MMTYEERQVIREVSAMLQCIKMQRPMGANEYPFEFGKAQRAASFAMLKLDSLLSDPEDLPSEAYDANDAQEMGRL